MKVNKSKKELCSKWRAAICCLLLLLPFSVMAQSRTVSGSVVDNFGEPLPFVVVAVQGVAGGTMTNDNGEFSITVPNNEAILQFTLIGFQTEEVVVGNRNVIMVTLHEDVGVLEELVVTAFGTQRRESIVASITTVDPRQLRVPSSNLTTAFAGQIAGVIAYQRTGEPGLDHADFFIRGVTTFGTGAANPLILIDNVELTAADLARLNPDDIASFSVLKDATATALYGARGANGVILVTTREGREGPVQVSARIENSWSAPTRRVQVADPMTFMLLHNEAVRTRDPMAGLPYSESSILARQEGRNPYVFPMVDWMDKMFKNATMNQRGNISLSGGGTVARYFVALNYARDTGILRVNPHSAFNNNISLNRYGIRSNINLRLTRSTDLAIRVSGSFEDYQGPIPGGSQLFRNALRSNPVRFPAVFAPDAANAHVEHPLFGNAGTGGYYNPYADMVRGFRETQNTSIIAQMELRQSLDRVMEGLRWRILGSTTRHSAYSAMRAFRPFWYSVGHYNPLTDVYTLRALNPEGGSDWLEFFPGGNNINSTIYMETALQYDRLFGNIHNVSGMLVFTAREQVSSNASETRVDGILINTRLHNSLPFRNVTLAGRFTYGLLDRYFAEFNFGYNASERFDRQNRWGFFPSAGLGWMISREPWYEDSPISNVMNLLQLRATYGLSGNDAISRARFFHLSAVNMTDVGRNFQFGTDFNEWRTGIGVGRYANPQVGWEIAHMKNFGLEMQFFNDLNIRADYFTERRTNILQRRADLPTTMGLQAIPEANVGEARGSGVDVSINYMRSFNRDFWAVARGNFTFARSRFYIFEEPDFSATPWRSRVGHSLSQQWGLIAERLFIDEEDVLNSPQQMFGPVMPGDIKFMDINGDGIIDERDMVPIGFPTRPEIIYGFGASVGFRNFDANVFFQGSARSSFWVDSHAVTPFVNAWPGHDDPYSLTGAGNNAVLRFIERDHWSEANQNPYAAWPRLSPVQVANNNQRSTWFMHNGAFLRLKSAEIGYTLPTHIYSRASLSSARFYVSGTNLFTFSAFRHWDIEMGGNGLAYPIQRVINLGLQVSF